MTNPQINVESTANPRVKSWVGLSKRAQRDRTGTFLIEGARESQRATQRLEIVEIIWCPDFNEAMPRSDAPVTTVSTRVFEKVSHRQNPDGVVAVARTPSMSLASFDVGAIPLVLVADGIEKPGNIGAMLRSCDAFGASFIGSSLATDIVNPNVVRAAQGSLFATATADVTVDQAVDWCTAHTSVIVAHPTGVSSLWKQDFRGPTSIVVGSEHAGVDPLWLGAGNPVFIPMSGIADSLNASVSAGVFLAETARQRSD